MSAHLIPHPSAPVPLAHAEVAYARKRLILGVSLADIADALGVEVRDVDLALWGRLIRHGRRLDRSAA